MIKYMFTEMNTVCSKTQGTSIKNNLFSPNQKQWQSKAEACYLTGFSSFLFVMQLMHKLFLFNEKGHRIIK